MYIPRCLELRKFLTYDLFYVAPTCEYDTCKSYVTYAIGGCVTRDTCYLCRASILQQLKQTVGVSIVDISLSSRV